MNDSAHILTQLSSGLESLGCSDNDKIWVGYSGGLDSTVLLHAAAKILGDRVIAIHVNHQLSDNSNTWESHCIEVARRLGVRIVVDRINVTADGKGLEAEARKMRYETYEKHIEPGRILLLGHHLNDQVETFFLRMLRGAGVDGLTGISVQRWHKRVLIFRPLLDFHKFDLKMYAETNGLCWVDDESNQDEQFDRNYLRHSIFPVVERRWPGFVKKIAQAQEWLRESEHLLIAYAKEDLVYLDEQSEKVGKSICLNRFQQLSKVRQKHVLRTWVKNAGYSQISARQLEQVDELIYAKVDARPEILWGKAALTRFQQRLFLLPRLDSPSQDCIRVSNRVTTLPNGFELIVPESWLMEKVQIRFRSAGLRCHPNDREHSQSLKKLLQEYSVPPWLRNQVPLIYVNDELVAVGDYFGERGTTWSACAADIVWHRP